MAAASPAPTATNMVDGKPLDLNATWFGAPRCVAVRDRGLVETRRDLSDYWLNIM